MFRNYLKTAYRNLLRNKGFTFINLAGLTLGLTACLLISLFVWDELQFDRFIPEGERVYRLYNERTTGEVEDNMVFTQPMYATVLGKDFPEVEEATRVYQINAKILFEAEGKKMYEENGVGADPNLFDVLPMKFVYGSAKGALTDPASIVISKSMAQRYFGDANPVGKELLFDTTPYQVKGVFENNPKFHLQLTYILPMAALELPEERMQSWSWQQFNNYVKLKEGADPEALQAKFQAYIKETVWPQMENIGNSIFLPELQPLHAIHLHSADFKYDMAVRGNISYVRALSIIALFILLIASFNFVNLATAKSLQRAKEVGVRKTIGASRRQLMVQFIIETLMLALISIVLAVLLVYMLLPWLNEFAEKQISLSILTKPLVLLLLLALTGVVGVIAGLYPALVLSAFKPVKVLKGSAASNSSPGKVPWLRHGLVVVQFAISVLLIISALVVYQQVEYLNNKDLGFEKEQIMFFPMRGDNMFANYETFKNDLLQSPGVSNVSIGYGFPGDLVAGDGIIVPQEGEQKRFSVTQLIVDYDYIETLGVELVAGRNFSKEITTDASEGFMINETAVKALGFGTPEKALGQPLHWDIWGAAEDSLKIGKIIGVVADFHYKSLYDKVEPTVLQIFPPVYWKVAVKVETAALAGALEHVQEVWNKFSPEYPLEYSFLDESFTNMYKAEDKLKSLLWIFTGIAIFVGCLGLFGLAAYAAERRTKEIGIRKVLGATEQNIVALLSKDFLKLVLIAFLIASPIAWYFLNQWLQDFAYRIDISWWVFALAGLAAVAIALLTVSFHAIKAALRNPVKNLRTE